MDRRSFLSLFASAPIGFLALQRSTLSKLISGASESSGGISSSMWLYPWDLVDEGYEPVLKRISELGITGISLATAYHTGKFLEPHDPKRKVVFLEDGTVYFNPDRKRYGRIQPRINSMVKEGEGLEKTRRIAGTMGLSTNSWIVCCHNTALGMEYPDVACIDAFGDPIYHNLCPSNPDVRQYLCSLIGDVASHDVERIELEALQFQGYTHGYHHEREGIDLNIVARFLLGLCFCPSCMKRAHDSKLDLAPVRNETRKILESYFAEPSKTAQVYPDLESLSPDVYGPFLEWRKRVVYDLLGEIREAAGKTSVRQLVSIDPLAQKLVSADPVSSAKLLGGVLLLGYVRDGDALKKSLSEIERVIDPKSIIVGLQVGLPESGGKKEFQDKMNAAKSLGISQFNFYNYGFIPYQNLEWIRDVVKS
ncbi:MAG TPA: hypothetical protein VMH23_00455 [Bacteroidota bacterium]|nr:hypothetical protein [Bacteroidota bacterium]